MGDAPAPDPTVEPADPVGPPDPVPASRRVRARYVVAALVCAGAVVWLVVAGLASNIVWLQPVSDAVDQRESQGERRFRIAGEVVAGTIDVDFEAQTWRFDITDGRATAEVVHVGAEPPELFDDGAPVVCEGRWDGEVFASDRILIKHGSDYRPPDVDQEPAPSEGEGS